MVASNNNNDRRKEKRAAVDGDGDSSSSSSLSSTPPPVGATFGNMLQRFPDFLIHILPYIADRRVWNSIASSNRDTYKQSKVILPPWPMNYRLTSGYLQYVAWSPCGTSIAYSSNRHCIIEICDQRRGPLRINRNNKSKEDELFADLYFSPDGRILVAGGDDCFVRLWDSITAIYKQLQEWIIPDAVVEEFGDNNNGAGWSAHNGATITYLEFSQDGRLLVSGGGDSVVKLWDSITGIYEQLQEWNVPDAVCEEFGDWYGYDGLTSVSVSACSNFIAVSTSNDLVILKDIKNGNKPIKWLVQNHPAVRDITKIVFSSDGRAVLICCRENNTVVIKVWRPYLDDDDESSLVTLSSRLSDSSIDDTLFTFSQDSKMVAIHSHQSKKGTLWSIDIGHNCMTQKLDFLVRRSKSQKCRFTPDNKYFVYNTKTGPKFWCFAEGIFIEHEIQLLENGNKPKENISVVSISPNNQQLIVQESISSDLPSYDNYITSYFLK